jgi:translocation and assembly module TamA
VPVISSGDSDKMDRPRKVFPAPPPWTGFPTRIVGFSRRPNRFWRQGVPVLAAATLCAIIGGAARAADPQPYTVKIGPTGDAVLDAALKGGSQLVSLRKTAPVGPFALVLRAKQDIGRFETVLQSYGYYDGTVGIELDGHKLDDAGLADLIDKIPKGTDVTAAVTVEEGPLFHLGRVTIEGAVPPDARAKFALKPGEPAVADAVLAAGARLLSALEEDGYALATVATPVAIEDPQKHVLNVSFTVVAGRRATIGPISFAGLKGVNASFVRRRLLLHGGELYQPSKIERARQDLASIGVFSGVSVHAGKAIAPDGRIPIVFDFQERPKYTLGVTGAYSTDLGASLSTSWTDHNLFGNAETLKLSAAGTGLAGDATQGLGYDLSAQLVKPDFLRRDQSLEFDAAALKQDLQAYHQTAVTAGTSLHRKFSTEWSGSIGISGERERIEQEGVTRNYTLLGLPLTAKFDSTGLADPLQDPTHGVRAAATATPTLSFGSHSNPFTILQLSGSTYIDLHDFGLVGRPGRSVLALRGLVGSVEGASEFEIPPDQRFYGGGSATVRGFRYQSIGPQFADGNPIGGTAIDAGTVEFRQRLFTSFGAAAFVDAGQVSADNVPGQGPLEVGAGIGVRYYTSIGPIRVDIAVPVTKVPGGDRFELYLGLGQAF